MKNIQQRYVTRTKQKDYYARMLLAIYRLSKIDKERNCKNWRKRVPMISEKSQKIGKSSMHRRRGNVTFFRKHQGEWSRRRKREIHSIGKRNETRGKKEGPRRTNSRILTRGRSTGNWKGRGFEGLSCAPDSVSAAVQTPPTFIHSRTELPAAAFHYSGSYRAALHRDPNRTPGKRESCAACSNVPVAGRERGGKGTFPNNSKFPTEP